MTVICGDCLEVMKTFPENHFSGIVTDPPYGLHFMGKEWDYGIPDRSYWEACYKLSKPGAHLLAFGGTRTFHRLMCEIEDAGFEIRDTIMWIYGSGFPKSHNSFGIEGYGTALKPAYEPIIMAMKPCEGTFKQNAATWGQAGINIEGCRIGREEICAHGGGTSDNRKYGNGKGLPPIQAGSNKHKGRWPANVIFDDEAAQMLDEQSGISRSSGTTSRGCRKSAFAMGVQENVACPMDSGGASRFFYCAKASSKERNEGLDEIEPIKYGTGALRDCGLGKIALNNHPTVKPLKLMEYLIKLIMPPKDALLLDPFLGSGTTLIAAKNLGVNAIGIEKEPSYCEIAKARIGVA